jgi:integrase
MEQRRGHKEGGISKRYGRDGTFLGYQVQALLPNGHRKTLGTTRTWREAKQLAQRGYVDINAGRWSSTTRRTVEQYLNEWLDMKRPSIRYGTVVSYQRCIRLVAPHIGRLRLDALAPADIQDCYAALLKEGRGARSVALTHSVLHAAFRRAVQLDLAQRNPTEAATPPRVERNERPALTLEQLDQLIAETADPQLRVLMLLLATAGPRIGEALAIRWSDVDLKSGMIRVERTVQRQKEKGLVFSELKTKLSRRTVTLVTMMVPILREHRQRQIEHRLLLGPEWHDDDLVFPSAVGTPLDPMNAYHRFQAALQHAGLPRMRLHDLRHTATTLMMAAGLDPVTIQRTLGHANITLTLGTYSHVMPSMQRDAVQKMDVLLAGLARSA